MNSRCILRFLVFSLPLLVVAFAILMGAAWLSDALHDPFGARCLRWVAAVALMFIVGDVLFVVGMLGLEAVACDIPAPHEQPHKNAKSLNSEDTP